MVTQLSFNWCLFDCTAYMLIPLVKYINMPDNQPQALRHVTFHDTACEQAFCTCGALYSLHSWRYYFCEGKVLLREPLHSASLNQVMAPPPTLPHMQTIPPAMQARCSKFSLQYLMSAALEACSQATHNIHEMLAHNLVSRFRIRDYWRVCCTLVVQVHQNSSGQQFHSWSLVWYYFPCQETVLHIISPLNFTQV